jgi:hypothetical protein
MSRYGYLALTTTKFSVLIFLSVLPVSACATDPVEACRQSFEGRSLQANDLIVVGTTLSSDSPAPRGGQGISFVLEIAPMRVLRNPGVPLTPRMRVYDNLMLTDILRHLPEKGSVAAMQLRPARREISEFAEYELVRTGCGDQNWGV